MADLRAHFASVTLVPFSPHVPAYPCFDLRSCEINNVKPRAAWV